jgi:regulator of replication initiation timing
MTLNPITALSEQLQKLINERGSTAILRDHLALFRDQVVILEKKATLLVSENTILKTENTELKTKIEQLTKDNDELKKKIQHCNTPDDNPMHDRPLVDVQVEILKLLYKQPNRRPEDIRQSFKADLEAIKFHLTELKKMKMVQTDTFGDYPTYQVWLLAQEGRRYVIEHTQNP